MTKDEYYGKISMDAYEREFHNVVYEGSTSAVSYEARALAELAVKLGAKV